MERYIYWVAIPRTDAENSRHNRSTSTLYNVCTYIKILAGFET